MATYMFYADEPHKRRSDGRNVALAQGNDLGAARAAAEALLGEANALASFAAVNVSAVIPPVVIEGHPPVGAVNQSVWPTTTRGGGRLRSQ